MNALSRMSAALFSIAVLSLQTGPAYAQVVSQHLSLETGHSLIVKTPGLRRVAVGDGKIAGIVPIGTGQLLINGKDAGETSIFVWSDGGERTTYVVDVTNQTMNDLAAMLRTAIDAPGVSVVSFGHAIVLKGTVPDMAQFARVSDIVSRFDEMEKQEKYSVVNAVTVAHSLDSIQRDFANSKTIRNLSIEPDGKGNVIVSGNVHDKVEGREVLDRAQSMAGPYLSAEGKVIDRLTYAYSTQIDVKVYVLEVDRTALSNLGVQLQSAVPDPSEPGVYTLTTPSFPLIEGPQAAQLGKALNVGAFFRSTALAPTINLLVQNGHARILSEPNLVALPGAQAKFLVGGEIPYAYSTGLGQVSIEWKNYGVQLNVTPDVLPNGSIETKINPDITDLDYENAIRLNGFSLPALKESTLTTDVITAPGQSIIMGGLLRRVDQKTISKVPLLADIPILGKLFQSTDYQSAKTDVVFVMTPEIINQ